MSIWLPQEEHRPERKTGPLSTIFFICIEPFLQQVGPAGPIFGRRSGHGLASFHFYAQQRQSGNTFWSLQHGGCVLSDSGLIANSAWPERFAGKIRASIAGYYIYVRRLLIANCALNLRRLCTPYFMGELFGKCCRIVTTVLIRTRTNATLPMRKRLKLDLM
ncbi:MAG: hypothetical protein IBX61_06170 [Thermoleophilia bacterium]|nr:hypothetical protein [Thermoleophilia bacterium]